MLTILLALAAAQQPVPPKPVEDVPPLAPSGTAADTPPLREIGEKEVRIVNRTGLASKRVEASNWETPAARPPRTLDVRVLANDETLVDFDDGVRDCRYRVTILFEDGRIFSDPALNACTQKEVVITDERLRPAR